VGGGKSVACPVLTEPSGVVDDSSAVLEELETVGLVGGAGVEQQTEGDAEKKGGEARWLGVSQGERSWQREQEVVVVVGVALDLDDGSDLLLGVSFCWGRMVSRREREREKNSCEGEEKLEMWEPDHASALLAAKGLLTGGGTSGTASTGG